MFFQLFTKVEFVLGFIMIILGILGWMLPNIFGKGPMVICSSLSLCIIGEIFSIHAMIKDIKGRTTKS